MPEKLQTLGIVAVSRTGSQPRGQCFGELSLELIIQDHVNRLVQRLLNGFKLSVNVFHWPVILEHLFDAAKLSFDIVKAFYNIFFLFAAYHVFGELLYEI